MASGATTMSSKVDDTTGDDTIGDGIVNIDCTTSITGATTMSSTLGVTIEEKNFQKFIKDHKDKIKSEDDIRRHATSEQHFDTLCICQKTIQGCLEEGYRTKVIPPKYDYGGYKCSVCN